MIELTCARGLVIIERITQAEEVLRSAIDETEGDNLPRAKLHVDLAEFCIQRREAAAVLDLMDQVEAMGARAKPVRVDGEVRSGLLRLRCQAWILLGRQERAAALAAQLADLSPGLPPYMRRPVALQRGNALLALSAWDDLEKLALEELSDAELPDDDRARWRLRRGRALSELARLKPVRAAEARREIEAALAPGLLDVRDHDDGLLALAEIEVRERATQPAETHLAELVARHPELAAGNAEQEGLDVDQRALFECLQIELALAKPVDRAQLDDRRQRAHAALHAMRDSWLSRPTVPGGQGFLLYGEARLLLGQIARVEIALEGERVGVERAIAALALLHGAGTAARSLDQGTIDAARLRLELLSDDTSLLLILPNSLRTHVFVLEPDGAIGIEGAPLEQLEVLRGAHARWLFTPPGPSSSAERAAGLRTSGALLRDGLLDARVIAALRSRPVVLVVGSDYMGGLPIESLDLAGGCAFGTERGIAHAPSLPLAVALAERSLASRAPGPWDAVVFGATEHGQAVREGWPRLVPVPLTESDMRALGTGFDPDRVHVLLGAAASLGGLQLPALESADLLQIVTHGVYDARQDDPAGLVVSPQNGLHSIAWRADLRALRVPRVVALWACGTQRGPVRFGDDTASHLGSAFLEANACSVLVSRADVALEPTLRMARRFARELARGVAPVEALRAARAELAGDDATADPFFHAPIVLYGDPGRGQAASGYHGTQPRGSDGVPVLVLVAALIAAIALAVLVARRLRARA